jgi:5-hydroxyisourate hydrolase
MITTHVLDTARGIPAAGVAVRLDIGRGEEWVALSSGCTDERGRLTTLTDGFTVVPGRYRLAFDAARYQAAHGSTSFFPEIQVIFEVQEASDEHFHVPLALSPFGYSAYRGV